jgi:hypothetical protein
MLEAAFSFGALLGVEGCVGTETPLSHPMPPAPPCVLASELGCLQDAEKRVFPDTVTISDQHVSWEWCAGQCSLRNRSVAAVEFAVACFCGDLPDVAAATKLPRSDCAAMKCAANNSEDCGGGYVMLAYNFTCQSSSSSSSPGEEAAAVPIAQDYYEGMFTRLMKRVPSLAW